MFSNSSRAFPHYSCITTFFDSKTTCSYVVSVFNRARNTRNEKENWTGSTELKLSGGVRGEIRKESRLRRAFSWIYAFSKNESSVDFPSKTEEIKSDKMRPTKSFSSVGHRNESDSKFARIHAEKRFSWIFKSEFTMERGREK